MTPTISHGELLVCILYAIAVGRPVTVFDGVGESDLRAAYPRLMRSLAALIARPLLGPLRTQWRKFRMSGSRGSSSKESSLFGLYTKAQTFSLPLDAVTSLPARGSVYGKTRGLFLPAYSARGHRFSVNTTRHRLRDVSLHVEAVGSGEVSCLIQDGRLLSYPYFIVPWSSRAPYCIATRKQVIHLDRGVCLLAYTSGYYHWLLEGVPRILDLIDDGTDFDRYPLILPPLASFQRELLILLGISPDSQVVTVGEGDWCHVEDCIYPTAPFPFGVAELEDPSGQPDRTMLLRLRDRLLAKVPASTSEEQRLTKVYISRAHAAKRRLTDPTEAKVQALLSTFGYSTVYLEDHPWIEQVRLLRSARSIVGFHGAGLANIIFSEATQLLEFSNPMEARPYFSVIARELDIRYRTIIGTLEGISPRFDNITIDIDQLRALLEVMED
ncbi:glycosyltransferase family 61 protein [Terriglobus roseus]|nr:glycosyltransferase 61 family protein [Terriglobus roseus]